MAERVVDIPDEPQKVYIPIPEEENNNDTRNNPRDESKQGKGKTEETKNANT